MSSILKVDSITDVNGNAIISSDGSGNLSIPNLTTTGDINFGDNDKAQFGASQDLQIYHDGSNSIIHDNGTGNLRIRATNFEVANATYTKSYIFASDGGAVTLKYNNANKLDTTSSGIDVTGTVVSDGLTVDTNTLYVDSTNNNIGIGTTTPSTGYGGTISNVKLALRNDGAGGSNGTSTLLIGGDNNHYSYISSEHIGGGATYLAFGTATGASNPVERCRIDTSGHFLVGTTSFPSSSVAGLGFQSSSNYAYFARSGAGVLNVDRHTNDGTIVDIRQDGTAEGTISVSGATVAYNGFTGTHWSRLSDNSKPTILKGTILESIDEMMDWYQVQFDITDDEGNTRTEKQSYTLGDGESVGDVITYNYEGTDYQATIIQEGDVKHTKAKISDTVDAKNVYGVFMDWDNDDDTVNDMYVAQTGTFVVRINGSETVSKGDLIQSNGDGTGKVQADDLLRASTVAKVLSTTKIETYDDGSYIVPCSLHC